MDDSSPYVLSRATIEDVPFLAVCIRDAERAHTGRGIWDTLIPPTCPPDFDIKNTLALVCSTYERSHFHVSRFMCIRERESGRPVAAACGFVYPQNSLSMTLEGLSDALFKEGIYKDKEEADLYLNNLNSFLEGSFPDDIDYDNSWLIEAVYTSPEVRGKKLASKLVNALYEDGKTTSFGAPPHVVRKCLISCAVGNTAAYRCYAGLGFVDLGKAETQACMDAIGSPGFHIFCKPYDI